ncbi:hypothetical protein [Sphingomonas sp.]|uniref:hypothetical protein n=1 Tax=Sphingomonas sp. TaxID=28214 RepID=UPI0038A69FD7
MTDVTDKVERAIARFERVARNIDERDSPSRDAARRERQRLNAGLGRTVVRIAVAVALIWLATIILGLVMPIGMFGFLAALLVTGVVAAVLIASGGRLAVSAPAPAADLPNGAMVERFDSYVYRTRAALPAPARAELDAIAQLLPSLKQTLSRLETLDPAAQDARRLMSIHLPGLIERYERVPPAYRGERDGEGKTVDQRLVEGLSAGRAALAETSEQLARADVAALETQGRFIQSRYGEQGVAGEDAPST